MIKKVEGERFNLLPHSYLIHIPFSCALNSGNVRKAGPPGKLGGLFLERLLVEAWMAIPAKNKLKNERQRGKITFWAEF